MPKPLSATLPLLALLLTACATQQPVDLLIHNAHILTVDANFAAAEAMAIHDGTILATGSSADIRAQYRGTREHDLAGNTIVPGFNDSHTHLRGYPERHIDLEDAASIPDFQERVREKAALLGPDEWITGYGWDEEKFAEKRVPTRADLDAVTTTNPVILTRAGGHSAVANSLALTLAGIDERTPDPERGVIERGPGGRLNGIIRERQDIVARLVPKATAQEKRPSLIAKLRDQFRLGITSVINASGTAEDWNEWQRVYSEHGETLPRAAFQLLWPGTREELAAFGQKTGEGDTRLRLGALKIFVDGGFTGPAAYTLEPYKGQPDYRGKLNMTEAELREAIRAGHELGWQLGIHAIGDGAIVLTVDELAAALADSPRDDHRHYLNHFTVMPPAATMDKMAANGIAITQQPNFTYTLEGRYAAHLDGNRLAHNNPLRTPMNHGIFVAISSDILPIGPLVGLYAATTRKGKSGNIYGSDEALTIEEALRAYTRHGAHLTFEEASKGTLEAGMYADFTVLSEDPTAIDLDGLMDITVEQTYVGGKLVYSAGQ